MENFAQTASYRCMNYPGTDTFELMPVFSPMGATGQIVDDQVLAAEEALKEAIKKGFSIFADCYVSKDSPAVLLLLMDPTEPARQQKCWGISENWKPSMLLETSKSATSLFRMK